LPLTLPSPSRIFKKLHHCPPFQILIPICTKWTNFINYCPYPWVVRDLVIFSGIVIGLFCYVEKIVILKFW
jgi:hypothetical protein